MLLSWWKNVYICEHLHIKNKRLIQALCILHEQVTFIKKRKNISDILCNSWHISRKGNFKNSKFDKIKHKLT